MKSSELGDAEHLRSDHDPEQQLDHDHRRRVAGFGSATTVTAASAAVRMIAKKEPSSTVIIARHSPPCGRRRITHPG